MTAIPSAQAALQALADCLPKVGEPESPWCVVPTAELRQFIEGAEMSRVDAERLDWLDRDGGTHAFKIGNRWYTREGWGRPHHKSTDIRAAIDSARSAEQKGKT